MNNIALAADGSEIVQSLLQSQQISLDYLKVGPWMGTSTIMAIAQKHPTLLHCNNSVISPYVPLQHLTRLTTQTRTPWLSLHLGLPIDRIGALWQRFSLPFALMPAKYAFQMAVRNIRKLMSVIEVPLAIENQAQYRHNGHSYLVDPVFITQLVEKTDVNLLLDIGHAGVSAAMMGLTVQAYIKRLPIERIIELHVHRPGMFRHDLRDLHLALHQDDYDLIQDLICQLPNLRAVTLEYYGKEQDVSKQLQRLGQLLV